MATYIPNATQTTEPVESRTVESAALEFRTLKASINGRIEDVQDDLDAEIVNRIAGDAALQVTNNQQDVRIQAIESALLVIGEGGLPGTVYVQRLSGTGAQTAFTLDVEPRAEALIDIFINGLYQQKDSFTVAGSLLTFSEAPPAGTNNIEVVISVTIANVETDASLVSYYPTEATVTPTTVESKLREFVSVKDFGAVGDGVTDDTAAIQAAFSASNTLWLPEGEYTVAGGHVGWSGRVGVSLRGPGKIKRTDVGRVLYIENCNDVSIEGVSIEGQGSTYNASGPGIWLQGCTKFKITGNRVLKACRQGINIEASTDGVVANNVVSESWQDGIMVRTGSDRVSVVGNICFDNGDELFSPPVGEGIHLYDVSDCSVVGNVCSSNSDHGITLEGANYCSVTGNTSKDNTVCGISCNSGSANSGVGCVVSNNVISKNGEDGIIVSSVDDYVFSGNVIEGNLGFGIHQGPGSGTIQERTTISNNKIIGNALGGIIHNWNNTDCQVINNSLSGGGGRGILINRAESTNTNITGNVVRGFPTAQITDNGTSTRISGNDVGNKLSGRATLASGTATVTFSVAEPSANFQVAVDCGVIETLRITGKTTSGFTITSSNAASTAQVHWTITDSKTA